MLTEHNRTHRMDDPHDDSRDTPPPTATATPSTFPVLEEPSWLDDDLDEEMEAPRDSAFRGIWIGVVAAAITFALVFAVPHWLGWYDIGSSTQRAKREVTPESVIATVKPGDSPAEPAAASPPPASAPPAVTTPPAAVEPKAATAPHEAKPAPRESKPPVPPREASPAPREVKPAAAPREAKPAVAGRESKPVSAAAAASRRTFAVQIAAFKNARQAGRVAESAKRAGYAADVLRVDSSPVPWVVRIGGYSTREQAESARDALARKGFRGGFIL